MRIAAIADKVIDEGSPLSFTANATDADQPPQILTYQVESTLIGANVHLQTGLFTWTPTEAQGPSTNVFQVKVTDNGVPPLSDTKSFTVRVQEVNQAPVLAAIPDQTASVKQAMNLSLSAADGDLPTQVLAYNVEQGPTGSTVDAQSGQFTWTPTPESAGTTQRVTVQVTDNGVPPLSNTKSHR